MSANRAWRRTSGHGDILKASRSHRQIFEDARWELCAATASDAREMIIWPRFQMLVNQNGQWIQTRINCIIALYTERKTLMILDTIAAIIRSHA